MDGDDRDGTWAPDALEGAGEDDGEVYVLGLRESAEDLESWSLMFMECSDADDEQEIAQGMDTYCLVVDPGQATAYGGVLECELTDDRLRLVLSRQTAQALRTPPRLEFTLALQAEELAMVTRGLARVLTSGRPDAVPATLHL